MWREDSSNCSGRMEKGSPASLGISVIFYFIFFLDFLWGGKFPFHLVWPPRKSLEPRAGKTKHGRISLYISHSFHTNPVIFLCWKFEIGREILSCFKDFWAVAAGPCVLGCVDDLWVQLQTILCWKRRWALPADEYSWLEFKNDRLLREACGFITFFHPDVEPKLWFFFRELSQGNEIPWAEQLLAQGGQVLTWDVKGSGLSLAQKTELNLNMAFL